MTLKGVGEQLVDLRKRQDRRRGIERRLMVMNNKGACLAVARARHSPDFPSFQVCRRRRSRAAWRADRALRDEAEPPSPANWIGQVVGRLPLRSASCSDVDPGCRGRKESYKSIQGSRTTGRDSSRIFVNYFARVRSFWVCGYCLRRTAACQQANTDIRNPRMYRRKTAARHRRQRIAQII